jgi:WD40 repeat protein
MSWKKFSKSLNLKKKGSIFGQSTFYFCSLGYFTQNSTPEILLLSYDEKLTIFNSQGKSLSKFPFSSDVSALFLKDIYDNGENVFISFSYSGEIRVFSKEGEEIWKKTLPSGIVTGIVGNLDYDPSLEIVVLLEDRRIFVLNNQGQIMAKYQHPSDILFVDVGKINSSQKKVIVFVDQKNTINVLDIEASVQKLPTDIKLIRGFTTISIYDQILLAVADDSNKIHLLDKKGNTFETYQCRAPIQTIKAGPLFSPDTDALVILLENNYVEIVNIEVKNPMAYIESEKKQVIASTPFPQENLSAKLDFNSELYQKTPSIEARRKRETGFTVGKTDISNHSQDSLNLRCPECGDYLVKTLIRQILANKDAYCEECGRELKRKDFEI